MNLFPSGLKGKKRNQLSSFHEDDIHEALIFQFLLKETYE